MHELSVSESILNLAISHAEKANAARVTDIHLVIGRLSSIVDDSVQFYWDIISENTLCYGAKLHFDRRPAVLKCVDCDHEFSIDEMMSPCPLCGSYRAVLISGEEFYLDSIEIEKQSEKTS